MFKMPPINRAGFSQRDFLTAFIRVVHNTTQPLEFEQLCENARDLLRKEAAGDMLEQIACDSVAVFLRKIGKPMMQRRSACIAVAKAFKEFGEYLEKKNQRASIYCTVCHHEHMSTECLFPVAPFQKCSCLNFNPAPS